MHLDLTSAASKERSKNFAPLPFGTVPGYAPLSLDRNDVPTQVGGLLKRLGRITPEIDVALVGELKAYVARWLRNNLTPLDSIMEFEDWLSSTSYNEHRKQQLREYHDELYGAAPEGRRRRRIKSFIKNECYPEWKQPRWINSRSDYFKAYSGPAFKSIEKAVYENEHFIKHVPVPDRPAKIMELKQAGRLYTATDYSSFEAHFVPAVMDALELQLYDYMLSRFPDLQRTIHRTIGGLNVATTSVGVKFKCLARRMSGDMCTSLGNGFSNLMVWEFLYHRLNGPQAEWQGYVEGDDGIFAHNGVRPSAADYANLGFTIKIEAVNDPMEASFCGIVYADGENIRDPVGFLESFGWSESFLTAGIRVKKELLRAKALSAVYETPQCPITTAIARRALELTRDVNPRFINDGYHPVPPDEFKITKYNPSPLVRELYQKRFGISVEMQIDLEAQILSGKDDDLLGVALAIPAPKDILEYSLKYVAIG